MGVITWILIGVVSGWAATTLSRQNNRLVGNLLVGVIGASAGGFSANLVTRHPVLDFSWESLFVGILGTIVFLAIANATQRR